MSASLGQLVLIHSHSPFAPFSSFILSLILSLRPCSTVMTSFSLLREVSLLTGLNGFYDGLDTIVSIHILLSVKVYFTQLFIWPAFSFWMTAAGATVPWQVCKTLLCKRRRGFFHPWRPTSSVYKTCWNYSLLKRRVVQQTTAWQGWSWRLYTKRIVSAGFFLFPGLWNS